MKQWGMRAGVGAFGLAVALQVATAATESGRMSRQDAVEMVVQLVELVDTRALGPRDAKEQASARDALVREVSLGDGPDLDRAAVYAAARRYLESVDSDGHTLLWSRQFADAWEHQTSPADVEQPDVARVVKVGDANVLVLRPPQATFQDNGTAHDYAVRLTASLVEAQRKAPACALVVDLDAQQGGNAWPPIALLGAVVTPQNRARFEGRNGQRTAVLPMEGYGYAWERGLVGPLPDNPLARFAGTPIGVVMGPMTASAGEMLAVILAGESTTRSFGRPSYGMTTANFSMAMPDGAELLLSTSRYAIEGSPAIHGKLMPDVPAEGAETPEQSVQRAAAWAAANSPLCRAR